MQARRALLELLERYRRVQPDEQAVIDRIRDFVLAHEDCFERSCPAGHITASAWIESPDCSSFLMVLHRGLGKWLQLGGHADGETDTAVVAVREAIEESGLDRFVLEPQGVTPPVPFDLDVHDIPATVEVPFHRHYDIRFHLRAHGRGPLAVSGESDELRWFRYDDSDRVLGEESLRRMARKARLARRSDP